MRMNNGWYVVLTTRCSAVLSFFCGVFDTSDGQFVLLSFVSTKKKELALTRSRTGDLSHTRLTIASRVIVPEGRIIPLDHQGLELWYVLDSTGFIQVM